MPRYFYHLDNGLLAPDEVGVELAGRAEAWSMATQAFGQFIRDRDGMMTPGTHWTMEVVEDGRQLCWRLRIQTEDFVGQP